MNRSTFYALLTFMAVANQANGNTTKTLKHCEASINITGVYSIEHALISCLFQENHYLTYVRPATKVTEPVKVVFDMRHVNIINLDTKTETLNIELWTHEEWRDDRLTWNPADFGGLKRIAVPRSLIWTPNIIMYNRQEQQLSTGNTPLVTIKADGTVTQLTEQKAHSPCAMNMKHFPYDEQHCHLLFASWSYASTQLKIITEVKYPTHIYEDYNWKMASLFIDSRKIKSISDIDYSTAIYNMVMRRKTSYFTKTLVLPSVLVALLMCVLFFLSPQQRLNIAIALFIICTLTIGQVDAFLSTNAGQVPMIVSYIAFEMVMLTGQILMSLLVLNCLTNANKVTHVPQIVKTVLFGKVCRVLFIQSNRYAKHPSSSLSGGANSESSRSGVSFSPIVTNGLDTIPGDIPVEPVYSGNEEVKVLKDIRQILNEQSKVIESSSFESLKQMNESDWILLSRIVDRIFFIIFFILTILVTIALIHS